MLQKLLYFFSGLIIGGTVGYFTTTTILEEEMRVEKETEMEQTRKAIRDEMQAYANAQIKAAELNVMKQKFAEDLLELEQRKAQADKPVDYSAISGYSAAQSNVEDEWGDAKRPKGAPKRKRKPIADDAGAPYYEEAGGVAVYPTEPETEPHYISEDSYASDHFEYEKLTLFWFAVDDVVTDEEYQPLEDLALIGWDWQNHFGEEDDPDIVHVRNPKIAADYEIIRRQQAYAALRPG